MDDNTLALLGYLLAVIGALGVTEAMTTIRRRRPYYHSHDRYLRNHKHPVVREGE